MVRQMKAKNCSNPWLVEIPLKGHPGMLSVRCLALGVSPLYKAGRETERERGKATLKSFLHVSHSDVTD